MNPDDLSSNALHLSKFDPRVAPSTEPIEEEGQTIMIRRIAAETAEGLDPAEAVGNEFGLPLKEMLGVISHCYARGVFCSKDIGEVIRIEPKLREAIGRKLPGEELIRRFRRRYAEAIEETLENLYRVVPADGESTTPGDHTADTEIVRRQAQDRVHEATWTDNTKGRLP